MSAAQTDYIRTGNTFEWVDPGKIHTKPYTLMDFVDSNTTDNNFTFIGQPSDGVVNVYDRYCTNFSGDKSTLFRITPADKTGGTLTAMNYPDTGDGDQECRITQRTVGFREQQNAPSNITQTSPFSATAPHAASWVNDATLNVLQNNVPATRYIDGNPNDNNRTFKGPAFAHCSNNVVNTIVLETPTKGKVYYVTTAPPPNGNKTNCAVAVADIIVANPAGGGNYSQPCGGTPAQEDACIASRAQGNANWAKSCGNVDPTTAPQGSLCSPTGSNSPPPPYGPDADVGADPNDEQDPCDSLGDFSFRWIACPVLTTIVGFAETMDEMIADALNYDLKIFDRGTDAGKAFYNAWAAFRTIALGLVLIAGLIMVVSQGTGLQLFDAYTVRKVLPRLLIAVIGIVLSWPILAFVITFFNDLGHWIQTLILLPFQNAAGDTESNPAAGAAGTLGLVAILTAAFLGARAYLMRIGPWGIVSLIGTICLALLVVFLILSMRNVVITVCVLLAPFAIACYILNGTKQVFDFWQNTLKAMLVVFPIIMALLAAGKAMSLVTENGFMKILFFIAPYFFIPFAFKLAGGLMSTIFSLVNDRNKGAFDRLSKFRGDIGKRRMDEAVEGRGTNSLDKTLGASLARRYRAAQMPGGSAFGSRYRSASQKMRSESIHKMLEQDHMRGAGDDDATELAVQEGMTKERFITSLMAKRNISRQDAQDRLANLEASLGARLGSDAMQVAAFQARAASNTAYSPADYNQIAEDGARLVNKGLITSADAMSAAKANKGRADINGVGSGTWTEVFAKARSRVANGQQAVTAAEAKALRQEAITGSAPGMFLGGRHEAVTALAPQVREDLDAALRSGDDVAIGRELAKIAAYYEIMGQVSPKNADIFGEQVMSDTLVSASGMNRFQYVDPQTGKVQTMDIRRMVDSYRNNDEFLHWRREFVAANQAGAYAAAAAAGGAPQPGTAGPPGITTAPGAP